MNSFQKQYQTFIESVCTKFGCVDAIRPLQEGFSAMCEATNPKAEEMISKVYKFLLSLGINTPRQGQTETRQFTLFGKPCTMTFSQAGIKIVNDETGETYVDEERFGWTTTSSQLRRFTLNKVARTLITALTGIRVEPARILGEAVDDDDDGMRQCKVCLKWKYPEDLDENGICKAYQEDDEVYDACQRLYDAVGGDVSQIRRAKCQYCGRPIIGDQTMPDSYMRAYVCDNCKKKLKSQPARERCKWCGVKLADPSLFDRYGFCPACAEIMNSEFFADNEDVKPDSECAQCHKKFYPCELDDNGLCRECAGEEWSAEYTGRDPDMKPKEYCSVCHKPLYSVGSVDYYGRCRECEKKNLKPSKG